MITDLLTVLLFCLTAYGTLRYRVTDMIYIIENNCLIVRRSFGHRTTEPINVALSDILSLKPCKRGRPDYSGSLWGPPRYMAVYRGGEGTARFVFQPSNHLLRLISEPESL